MGFANAAPLFIPLYAEDELGAEATLGGIALALVGLASIPGRITWARAAERRGAYRSFLLIFAVGGTAAYLLVLLSDVGRAWWLLAAGAIAIGATSQSWNAVVTLAVLRMADMRPGAATGTVMLGFFLGLSVSSPIYGAAVDASGFTPVWLLAIVALVGAAGVALSWTERHVPRTAGDEPA
jgi:predicted MFS family arabinose efflux permease